MCVYTTTVSSSKAHLSNIFWVQVNQRNRFPPNVCRFPLPARPQWVEPAGGEERKSGGEKKFTDVERKMVTLIYPYPIFSILQHTFAALTVIFFKFRSSLRHIFTTDTFWLWCLRLLFFRRMSLKHHKKRIKHTSNSFS
jgi:hypothetical protein